jgi:HlyD family secretion protein
MIPKKTLRNIGIILVLCAAITFAVIKMRPKNESIVSGNGRIEATEIDVATIIAGRVEQIYVNEGDFVQAGQVVAQMQTDTLVAQRDEAKANNEKAKHTLMSAQAQVTLKESDKKAAEAVIQQREAELDAAQRRLARSEILAKEGAVPVQELDDDRANVNSATAVLSSAKAQMASAQAAIEAAKAQVIGAQADIEATAATIARIEADINDSQLKAPRDCRVQYRIIETEEVLNAGGKVFNLVDLGDVYMTFFYRKKLRAAHTWGTRP